MRSHYRAGFFLCLLILLSVLVLACSGGGGGGDSRGTSGPSRPTDAELQAELDTQKGAADLFDSASAQLGDDAARQQVLAFLQGRPDVVDAGIASDGVSIWIKYQSGVGGVIGGSPAEALGYASSPVHSLKVPAIPTYIRNSIIYLSNYQAVILAPVYPDLSQPVENLLKGAGFNVTPYMGASADVTAFEKMSNCGVIFIQSHGAFDEYGNVCFETGEELTLDRVRIHFIDLHAHLLHYGKHFWITPAFVYARGLFPDSLVFANACFSLGTDGNNTTMANAFNGAKTYYGYKGKVHKDFAKDTAVAIFETLTDFSRPESDRTTGVAFDNLPRHVDLLHWGAEFIITGSRDLAFGIVPFYRWNNGTDHYYTTDPTGGIAPVSGYWYEGIACYVFSTQAPFTIPLYRWFNGTDHYYTTDPIEELAQKIGYWYEDVACYVSSMPIPSTIPLFRWNNGTDHFYTTDPTGEIAPELGYWYEAVQCYVWPQ